MKFVFFLQEAFCGLVYADNAFAAGALLGIPLGELMTLFQTLWSAGTGYPFQILTLLKKRTESIGPASEYGLENAENAFVAGALPRTSMGNSQRSPRPCSHLASRHPSQMPPHSAPPALGSAPLHIISGYATATNALLCNTFH